MAYRIDPKAPAGCIGDCLACGKCGSFSILDSFKTSGQTIEPRDGMGIAADIGTTSIVLALLDLSDGTVLARHSFMNPQRPFGPDVISRINAANNGNLEALRRVVTESVAAGCTELLASRDIQPSQIVDIAVAGNTVMSYLTLGLPCESLGAAPFKPAYETDGEYDSAEVFGGLSIHCPVRFAPWLAAFVGGDITAGLLYLLGVGPERFILIDLGTNGEMALYDHGKLTVTSTAAGPVFESGAGGGASDVISKLAFLVEHGHLDETGLLAGGAPDIFSQREIRELQLAKSAVRSGQEILLEAAGLDCHSIEAVYLAGGIGQEMDIKSAVTVGLLSPELSGKARAAGNTSLAGAAQLLLAPESSANRIKNIRAAANDINLAVHPRFNDCFMEYMCF